MTTTNHTPVPVPLTHEQRLVLIRAPWPSVRVYGPRTPGGTTLVYDDHSWRAALNERGGRKPSMGQYEH